MRLVEIATSVFLTRGRRHTRLVSDWSSDVCSSDLMASSVAGDEEVLRLHVAVDDAMLVRGGQAQRELARQVQRLAQLQRALRKARAQRLPVQQDRKSVV